MSCNLIQIVASIKAAINYIYPGTQPTRAQLRLLMQFEDPLGVYSNKSLKDEVGHVASSSGTVEIAPISGAMGNSALYAAGNGYVNITSQSADSIGLNDFTWEARLHPLPFGVNASDIVGVFSMTNNLNNTYTSGFSIIMYKDGRIGVGTDWNPHLTTPAGSVKFNEWNHFAVTRKGSTLTIWINGIQRATTAVSGWNIVQTQAVTLASARWNGGLINFKGYLDEVRMVKGLAVYETEFVPANGPYVLPTT